MLWSAEKVLTDSSSTPPSCNGMEVTRLRVNERFCFWGNLIICTLATSQEMVEEAFKEKHKEKLPVTSPDQGTLSPHDIFS